MTCALSSGVRALCGGVHVLFANRTGLVALEPVADAIFVEPVGAWKRENGVTNCRGVEAEASCVGALFTIDSDRLFGAEVTDVIISSYAVWLRHVLVKAPEEIVVIGSELAHHEGEALGA